MIPDSLIAKQGQWKAGEPQRQLQPKAQHVRLIVLLPSG